MPVIIPDTLRHRHDMSIAERRAESTRFWTAIVRCARELDFYEWGDREDGPEPDEPAILDLEPEVKAFLAYFAGNVTSLSHAEMERLYEWAYQTGHHAGWEGILVKIRQYMRIRYAPDIVTGYFGDVL